MPGRVNIVTSEGLEILRTGFDLIYICVYIYNVCVYVQRWPKSQLTG